MNALGQVFYPLLIAEARVSKIHDGWLERADTDLRCADILFKNGEYACTAFHLQQADEKIAKGILNALGFMAEDPATTQLFGLVNPQGKKIFGDISEMRYYTAKGYGHAWHERMLDFMKSVDTWLSSWGECLRSSGERT
jgi:HEPN domain-containing protein